MPTHPLSTTVDVSLLPPGPVRLVSGVPLDSRLRVSAGFAPALDTTEGCSVVLRHTRPEPSMRPGGDHGKSEIAAPEGR